jgi:adenosine deaminase
MQPLEPAAPDPIVEGLPKADLHLHQESRARLDRIAAERQGRPPHSWRSIAQRTLASPARTMDRLALIYEPDASLDLGDVADSDPAHFITRVAHILEEAASDGAILVEVRFGADDLLNRPNFMPLFREAESRARARYPNLVAEAIGYLNPTGDPAKMELEVRRLEACLRAAREGLGGVDFRVDPYVEEAPPELWAVAYRWAETAHDAGLGVTVHAGEFSTANIEAALRMPGLGRVGHGIYAAYDERLLDSLARSGATLECSLTCNVVLGAVRSYEAHPIRRFVEHGIPVTLSTDLPVHVCTTIGREYAVASSLGFTRGELLGFTSNAVRASFTTGERRPPLLAQIVEYTKELAQ